jgi:hypothetical protein
MKLQIDNLDGLGLRDYTSSITSAQSPHIIRKLNQPAQLALSLIADSPQFMVPAAGARLTLTQANNQDLFTGYLIHAPLFEYLGWGGAGPVYRYDLMAQSDERLLNEKRTPDRSPFVYRSAGDALRQLTQSLLPGAFDTSAVQDLDAVADYASDPQKTWSQQAAEIATQARASYRVMDGAVLLAPLGAASHSLNEADSTCSPDKLRLQPVDGLINDITIVGEMEPQAYVRDYFLGDGLTLKFYLSQTPFIKTSKTLFDEEYIVAPLDTTRWAVIDPSHAVSVSGGKLQIAGGTGIDGGTAVEFSEKIELGGALVMQHGDVQFSAASSGVLGGLYAGAVSIAGCLAGFQVTPSGGQSNIQALVNGATAGTAVATVSGHHYLLTTRLYSQEVYRRQQTFHSSLHPAGGGIGGAEIPANVRLVLELRDIDPANPATQIAAATVLYDGLISGAPDVCTYALVDAANLQCSIAFTRLVQAVDAEVRSALPGQSYTTQIVGSLTDGAQCTITSSSALDFYPSYAPAANQAIEVHYRSLGRALARITDPASIAAQQRGLDNGLHGAVRHVKEPLARTATDCEHAALALLDDSTLPAWAGQYNVWSDFLPGTSGDIFPGDALSVSVPSRSAVFTAIVSEVEITVDDLQGEHFAYQLKFANDATKPLGFEFVSAKIANLPLFVIQFTDAQVGTSYLPDLTAAVITGVSSTTVTINTGIAPISGGGFEARWSDTGWGAGNDRNLIGRFTSQTFTIPRLSRIQNCYLRQYDGSNPPRLSRYTAALHLDYPL